MNPEDIPDMPQLQMFKNGFFFGMRVAACMGTIPASVHDRTQKATEILSDISNGTMTLMESVADTARTIDPSMPAALQKAIAEGRKDTQELDRIKAQILLSLLIFQKLPDTDSQDE